MKRASILAALVLAACGGETDNGSRLVVLLTDAPGEFQEVPIEITALQARYAGASVQNRSEYKTAATASEASPSQSGSGEAKQQQGGEGAGEWIRVTEQTQQHDLLQLQNGKTAALGDAELPAGFYDRIRLKLARMQVVVDGATHELQVPAEGIELEYKFQAEAGKGQEMTLDFDAKQSIQQNGDGGYELKPVVEVKQLRYTHRHRTCEGEGECTAGEQSAGECKDAACQQQQAQPAAPECQGDACQQPEEPPAECQGDACQQPEEPPKQPQA